MATTFQEEVYWTSGEVWVTDQRVVFVDKQYMLDKIKAVSVVTSTFEQRLRRKIGVLPLAGVILVVDWLLLHTLVQADRTMQGFVTIIDWTFSIALVASIIGAFALLLFLLRLPRGNFNCIVIGQGLWKRGVFASTNADTIQLRC